VYSSINSPHYFLFLPFIPSYPLLIIALVVLK
jgi:hypothetical protein